MTAEIIDGNETAKQIRRELTAQVQELSAKGVVPGLAAILVGNDPASEIYVNSKAKNCQKVGIYSEVIRKDADITRTELYSGH